MTSPTAGSPPCPDCGAPLTGATTCARCGLRLTGPEALRLWEVDQSLFALDAHRADLLAERGRLLAALRPGTVLAPAISGQVTATSAAAEQPHPAAAPDSSAPRPGVTCPAAAAGVDAEADTEHPARARRAAADHRRHRLRRRDVRPARRRGPRRGPDRPDRAGRRARFRAQGPRPRGHRGDRRHRDAGAGRARRLRPAHPRPRGEQRPDRVRRGVGVQCSPWPPACTPPSCRSPCHASPQSRSRTSRCRCCSCMPMRQLARRSRLHTRSPRPISSPGCCSGDSAVPARRAAHGPRARALTAAHRDGSPRRVARSSTARRRASWRSPSWRCSPRAQASSPGQGRFASC